MTIKDKIILHFFEEYASSNIFQNLIATDLDDTGIYPIPANVKESETLFESLGEIFKKYSEAFLKGAEINGNEEVNSDNDLASSLLMKVLTGEKNGS